MTYSQNTSPVYRTVAIYDKYYREATDSTYTPAELKIQTGFSEANGFGFLAERGIYPVTPAESIEYNEDFNTLVYSYAIVDDKAVETAVVTPISLANAKAVGKAFFREQYSLLVEKTILDAGYRQPALIAAALQLVGDRGADLAGVVTVMQGQITALDGFLGDVDSATTNDEVQALVESVNTVGYTVLTVTVSGGVFYIDGVQQPALSLTAGQTYRFNQNDATNAGHPLRIYTDDTKNSEIGVGIEIFGTPGSVGAYTEWTPNDAGTYSYQCEAHAAMGGDITVS